MKQFPEPEMLAKNFHSQNLRMFNSDGEHLNPEEFAQCISDTKRNGEEAANAPEQTLYNQMKPGDYRELRSGY